MTSKYIEGVNWIRWHVVIVSNMDTDHQVIFKDGYWSSTDHTDFFFIVAVCQAGPWFGATRSNFNSTKEPWCGSLCHRRQGETGVSCGWFQGLVLYDMSVVWAHLGVGTSLCFSAWLSGLKTGFYLPGLDGWTSTNCKSLVSAQRENVILEGLCQTL